MKQRLSLWPSASFCAPVAGGWKGSASCSAAAEESGLRVGDRVRTIDGEPVLDLARAEPADLIEAERALADALAIVEKTELAFAEKRARKSGDER